jgi:hypothetical protein
MEVSGQLYPQEKSPRAVLEAVVKRKIPKD